MPPNRKRFEDAFGRLAAAEQRFLESEFLAPVLGGGEVQVRIAGVVCRLRIEPADAGGWCVLRPTSHTAARVIRPATMTERQRFLELFPAVRLILCRREGPCWLAAPAHQSDSRFQIEGLVPVFLVDEADRFDVAVTRFDGSQFWFDGVDPRAEPAAAAYLRQSLAQPLEPEKLDRPRLTREQRDAYAALYRLTEEARRRAEAERSESRIRDALSHAGAELVDYRERADSYRITYVVDGRRHVCAVEKRTLAVQSAGICLSGQDRQFDLGSLVGVIREGERDGLIYRV